MKKLLLIPMLSVLILSSPMTRADIWGGDVVVLTKILVQSIQQLIQLKKMVSNANESLSLMKDINKGINDSLFLLKTINPDLDPGILKGWKNFSLAYNEIERFYGQIKNVKDKNLYLLHDKLAAEAVVFNNNTFKQAEERDLVAESIKSYSHQVSPGGAQKLTAQSIGVLIEAQNQGLRAQAKSLKIQAQSLALANKRDKEKAKLIKETVEEMKDSMSSPDIKPKFQIPRFN